MKAICNGVDLTDLIGYGYVYELIPQYGTDGVIALDGTDYSAKLRDRVHIVAPFIALTSSQLQTVLQLFPDAGAYVSWTFTDERTGLDRTAQMKYAARKNKLLASYRSGKKYWSGLSVDLLER